MRFIIEAHVNIETAPYDADDTAAELTDSVSHWIRDAYGRTDDHFGHNAVAVNFVVKAPTRPREEAVRKLRDLYDQITAAEQRRAIRLEESAAEAEETADYYAHDSLGFDINEERAEDLDALREAVRVALGVV